MKEKEEEKDEKDEKILHNKTGLKPRKNNNSLVEISYAVRSCLFHSL